MSLPLEILDYILGFLESDKTTLEACLRSYPTLSRLVERHLYSNVALKHPTVATIWSPDDFLEVLPTRPHIVNCVRALEIRFEPIVSNDFLEEISLFLPKLSRLRSIRLASDEIRVVRWQTLPEKFRVAFLDCLRSPYLNICTEYITFPLSILQQCKHIGRLTLRSWKDEHDEASVTGGDNICLPTIDSLALHGCGANSLPAIVSWIQSHCLSSLEFSDSGYDAFEVLPHILIGSSHSLTNLNVNIYGTYATSYGFSWPNEVNHPQNAIPIPLSVLRNLQCLTIRARLAWTNNVDGWGTPGFLSPVFAITELLKSASSFKHLTLDFHFSVTARNYEAYEHRITDAVCTPLHSLLVQAACKVESIILRVYCIKIPYTICSNIESNVIISMFRGHSDLRQFIENGKLILVDQENVSAPPSS